ncbi:MAG: TPMT family class I SAM-dependent methyltransferase [Planctomycetes bacterium]|nr:TPMT family class I SAM-dependent methyltransferase [Planctomycetota bacterium]
MVVSDAAYWEARYRAGEAGWDLGGPCPVFVELLDSPMAPPKGRVAFPGCGMGHDVRLFLDRGYDAVGFDFATRPEGVPVVPLDVFEIGRRYPEAFDAVVEYTCYCAIDPGRRAEYAAALRAALRPGGLLVVLAFPVERRDAGPPFGIEESEITGVLGAGMDLLHFETPRSSVEPRRGRERLAILRKR